MRAWPAGAAPTSRSWTRTRLVAVLQFYQDGVSRGIFPAEILDYHTTDDCWREYLAGEQRMTQVSAHRYLVERDRAPGLGRGSHPGHQRTGGGHWPGLGAGPGRTPIRSASRLAVEFMTQLLAPEANAAWNQAAGYLPTRQAALAFWDQTGQLCPLHPAAVARSAQPAPSLPNYAQRGRCAAAGGRRRSHGSGHTRRGGCPGH